MSKKQRKVIRVALLSALVVALCWQLNKIGYLPPINYWLGHKQIESTDKLETVINLPPIQPQLLNYEKSLSALVSTSIDKSKTAILVEKSDYKLTLYYQNQPIKSYPIVLGGNPIGDKMREGDYKTPEGIFKIRDLYPHPSWSKFIWLDYPNRESWRKHLEAKRLGKIKPSDTVGSEIGIHGVPQNTDYLIDERSNWTWGCVSLKNKDVDEIYDVVRVGTTVEIIP